MPTSARRWQYLVRHKKRSSYTRGVEDAAPYKVHIPDLEL